MWEYVHLSVSFRLFASPPIRKVLDDVHIKVVLVEQNLMTYTDTESICLMSACVCEIQNFAFKAF